MKNNHDIYEIKECLFEDLNLIFSYYIVLKNTIQDVDEDN